jgi:hypothetical protein
MFRPDFEDALKTVLEDCAPRISDPDAAVRKMITALHDEASSEPYGDKYATEVTIGGYRAYLSVTEYKRSTELERRRPAAIDIDCSYGDNVHRALLRTIAFTITAGLQHGVPLDTFVGIFIETSVPPAPAGEVKGDNVITSTSSVLDWAMRHLFAHYYPERLHTPTPVAKRQEMAARSEITTPEKPKAPPYLRLVEKDIPPRPSYEAWVPGK